MPYCKEQVSKVNGLHGLGDCTPPADKILCLKNKGKRILKYSMHLVNALNSGKSKLFRLWELFEIRKILA